MKLSLSSTGVLLVLSGPLPVFAAECNAYGLCGITPAASRAQMYSTRQHICGDTDLYKSSGCIKQNGALFTWPAGVQQRCWDAFENILNDCRPEGSGLHNHAGSYKWYNGNYGIHACSVPSC